MMPSLSTLRSVALGLATGLLAGTLAQAGTTVDGKAIAAHDQHGNWLSYGLDYSEQRFSTLTQIDDTNVGTLRLAWYLDLPGMRSLVSSPLAIDGVLYFSGSYATVFAVDAATGTLRWKYDPEVLEHLKDRKNLRINWDTNRGLAAWGEMLYVGTGDGRLIAIDRATGHEAWSVQTTDPDEPRYITGAPKAFNGKILIGHGGADVGPIRGYVTAYDAESGKQIWRSWMVPGNPADGFENDAMKRAAETWKGEWWRHGGGGTVWNAMTYDPDFNRVYLGTGNGTPWNQRVRSPGGGDNLYLCSILALDADTGEYAWHYQVNPGETWDYNAAMDMVLAEMPIAGKPRKVILHAPKNGFFYVIDRETGKLVSAEAYANQNWAERIDVATGRPVERAGARYEDGDEIVRPGILGAHGWQPMSFSPRSGLVYIPYQDIPSHFNDEGINPASWKGESFSLYTATNAIMEDLPPDWASSALVAWNPVSQKLAWKADHALPFNGGTLATAGNLVFQGTGDGQLQAWRASDGKPLWSFSVGLGVSAAPLSFSVGDTQYIGLLVGWGGAAGYVGTNAMAQHGWMYGKYPRRLLAFRLGGDAVMPALFEPRPSVNPLDDAKLVIDSEAAARGEKAFGTTCTWCHGFDVIASGNAPDLRASPIALDRAAFGKVLNEGLLQQNGMPRFQEYDEQRIDALYWYIRKRARESVED